MGFFKPKEVKEYMSLEKMKELRRDQTNNVVSSGSDQLEGYYVIHCLSSGTDNCNENCMFHCESSACIRMERGG